eukprot:7921589-Alexandrium_andersonii.AAC.1
MSRAGAGGPVRPRPMLLGGSESAASGCALTRFAWLVTASRAPRPAGRLVLVAGPGWSRCPA